MSLSTYSYSTQTSISLLDLQDHVSKYPGATFIWQLLTNLKYIILLLFIAQKYKEDDLKYYFEAICCQICINVADCIAQAAYELISPRIGTSYSSAGKVVYQYSVLMYFIIDLITTSLASAFAALLNDFSAFSIAIITFHLEHFMQVSGRVERWNQRYFTLEFLSFICFLTLFALLSEFNVKIQYNFRLTLNLFSLIFSGMLFFQHKYLRLSPKLLKPFKWHLLLQLIISFFEFLFFDYSEEYILLVVIVRKTENIHKLQACLYYLSMKISSSLCMQMYYYILQSLRLYAITKQGLQSIKTKSFALLICSIVWSIFCFLIYYPLIKGLIGNNFSTIMQQEKYSSLLESSKYGCLRGAAESLYMFEMAIYRAQRKQNYLMFLNIAKLLSVIGQIVITFTTLQNQNTMTIFNVQSICIFCISLWSLFDLFKCKKEISVVNQFSQELGSPKQDINIQNSGRNLGETKNPSGTTDAFQHISKDQMTK